MAAILVMLTGTAFAQEDDCKTSFPLQTGTGEITALTLFNFGKHLELQADTPKQEPLQDVVLNIDGKPAEVYPSLGLDDLLVGLSTDAEQLEVSDALLSALAKGKQATLTARTPEGKPAEAVFSLDGSAASVSRVKTGCKGG